MTATLAVHFKGKNKKNTGGKVGCELESFALNWSSETITKWHELRKQTVFALIFLIFGHLTYILQNWRAFVLWPPYWFKVNMWLKVVLITFCVNTIKYLLLHPCPCSIGILLALRERTEAHWIYHRLCWIHIDFRLNWNVSSLNCLNEA